VRARLLHTDINKSKTLEPLEPWTSADHHTREDLSPNCGAGMPETSLFISITGQNHIKQ
jgi:hypothetical protein